MSGNGSDSRLYPALPLLAVSIALFRDEEVLLIKRAKPPFEHVFTLPGGLVETGEHLEEAARRELWEEVAMKAGPLAFNRHVEIIERDAQSHISRHYVIASFAGPWLSGEGRMSDEVGEILWTGCDALGNLPLTPNLTYVIDGARTLATGKR